MEPLETETGVSALIRGGKPGKTVCIRHDIDALPIQEETELSFQSEVDGVSHACGHDIHTVIALYCGKLLNERKEELAGNVRIVFQPAEETGEGARNMMEAGFQMCIRDRSTSPPLMALTSMSSARVWAETFAMPTLSIPP